MRLFTRLAMICTILSAGLHLHVIAAPENSKSREIEQKPSDSVPAGVSPGGTLDSTTLAALKAQIENLRVEYEKKLQDLQRQIEGLQAQVLQAMPEPAVPSTTTAPGESKVVQSIPGALNPAISVVGNFVGRADNRKVFSDDGVRLDNKLGLREAEIDFRVPIDPYADGVLITSLESSAPGRFSADVEEGYVNIKKLPFLAQTPLGLKLKVGRFRPAFGKFNVLHTHDLPQTFRSLPTEEFLGSDGFIQDGVSANFFLPTPWDRDSSLDATLEILDGSSIALAPQPGGRNSYLGHLRWFRTLREAHNLELGWSSYFQPSPNHAHAASLHGLDFAYRWKPLRQGEWKSYLIGGEWMLAQPGPTVSSTGSVSDFSAAAGRPKGYSLFSQWQFNRRSYAGVRWDQTDTLASSVSQRRSVTPYFSYYFSEFLRFRLNFDHRWSDLTAEDGRSSVFLEVNWVFGSHPPEPFWVNR
jgi:hypothetical protein